MHDFTPLAGLLGGVLIGLAASLYLLAVGRTAGISGIFGGLVRGDSDDRAGALAFVAGLVAAGLAVQALRPGAFEGTRLGLPVLLAAGALVGFGTALGGGCTSGHGVCGLSRLSLRSLVATVTFIAAGMAATFIVRHVLGGGR